MKGSGWVVISCSGQVPVPSVAPPVLGPAETQPPLTISAAPEPRRSAPPSRSQAGRAERWCWPGRSLYLATVTQHTTGVSALTTSPPLLQHTGPVAPRPLRPHTDTGCHLLYLKSARAVVVLSLLAGVHSGAAVRSSAVRGSHSLIESVLGPSCGRPAAAARAAPPPPAQQQPDSSVQRRLLNKLPIRKL